jgi:hypothetical protein
MFYGVPPKRQTSLADPDLYSHPLRTFVVIEAGAIRTVFNQGGEFAIELRRRYHGITDNAKARTYVRTLVGCTPLPSPLTGFISPTNGIAEPDTLRLSSATGLSESYAWVRRAGAHGESVAVAKD